MFVFACRVYLQTVLYCRKMLLLTNLCTNKDQDKYLKNYYFSSWFIERKT